MSNQVSPKLEGLQPALGQDVSAEKTEEPKVVGSEDDMDIFWDEPADQDPTNPMNWSMARKWSIVAMISFITFLTCALL